MRTLQTRPWLVALALVALFAGVGGAIYAASTVTVTVRLTSTDPIPEGSGEATFQVRLSDPIADGELQIRVRTVDGTATAGSDYTALDQVLSFTPDGSTAASVVVPISQDTTDELNETFTVELVVANNTSGDTIVLGTSATALIEDDDSPDLVSVTGPSAPVLESAGNASFTVTLSASSPQPASLRWTLIGSGANPASIPPASPADVAVASGTWVVPAGSASRTFNIPISADALTEPDEQFTVDITSATNIANTSFATGQDRQVTIRDDDGPPSIITNAGLTVAEGGTGTIAQANLEASDPEQGPAQLTYTVSAGPTNGTLEKSGAPLGSGTFTQDDLNNNRITYIHNGGNTTSDSFTFSVSDGAHATNPTTFTITITPVDDPPLAVADTYTINEDAPNQFNVLINDTDADSGPRAVATATDPANGTVLVAGDGSSITYTPDADYCNDGGSPDTFTYTLTPGTSSASVSVSVTCVNDAPLVDANGAAAGIDYAATYTEAGGAVAIVDAALAVSDVEGDTVSGAVVKIIDAPANTADLLAVSVGSSGITANYDPASATLTLSGTQPATTYAQVLATLTFDHSSNNPGSGRTISIAATDTGTPAATSAPPAVITLTINETDELPAQTRNAGLTVAEAGTGTITSALLQASDNDTPPAQLIYTVEAAPANGVLQRSGTLLLPGSTFSQADIAANAVTYTHDGSETVQDGFAFTLSDRNNSLSTAIFVITVTPVNDAPVITTTAGVVNYSPGNPAVVIDAGALVSDDDSANLNAGSLTVNLSSTQSGDVVAVRNQGSGAGQIGVSGSTVSYGGQAIGTIASGSGAALQVNFTSTAATPAAIEALVRNITFAAPASATGSRSASFSLSDGDGGTSAPAARGISLTGAPVAVDDAATVAQDAPATAVPVLANDVEPEGGPLTIIAVTQGSNGTVVITGNGSGLTYQPVAGYSGPDSFTYTVRNGNGLTATATVTITVTATPPPPPVYTIFLPLLAVAAPPAQPDLTVSFAVSPASPQAGAPASIVVTVTNRGNAPASNFWVDFYINPSTTPAVNRPWNELCSLNPCFGLAWLYSGTLQPGQSVTLNSSAQSANNPNGFQTSFTDWRGYFANGSTTLYALVDSWNRDNSGTSRDPNGAVIESNETNNLTSLSISVAPGPLPAMRSTDTRVIPARPAFR